MALRPYFSLKCPNCGQVISFKNDRVLSGECPTFLCRQCGKRSQWNMMGLLWVPVFGIVLATILELLLQWVIMSMIPVNEHSANGIASLVSFVTVFIILIPFALRLRQVD